MTSLQELSEKIQKLCGEPRKTEHGEFMGDLTISIGGGSRSLFFLTSVFKDGSFLGFWSHSPCSHVRDQEQGWAVFSSELELLSECETRTSGLPAGNDFMKWRKKQTEEHGRSFKLAPEWDAITGQFWKITDC